MDPPAGMTLKVGHMKCLPIQCWREMNIASAAACCKPYLQGARLSDPLLHLLARLHVLCLDFSTSNTGMDFSTLSLRPVLLPMRRVQSLTLAFFNETITILSYFDQFFHFIQLPSLKMLLHPSWAGLRQSQLSDMSSAKEPQKCHARGEESDQGRLLAFDIRYRSTCRNAHSTSDFILHII